MLLRFCGMITVAVLVCSCATAYQPDGTDGTGGYTFARLSENVFKVEFSGNGFTEPKRAKDFALLRAAEICLEHNYRYFSISGEGDNSRTDTIRTGETHYTTGTINSYGGFNTFTGTTTSTATNIPVFKPSPSVTIICYDKIPGGHSGPVKSAMEVKSELRAKYKLNRNP